MIRTRTALLALALALPAAAHAQAPGCWVRGSRAEAGNRPSPLDSALVAVAGGVVKICYGSPSARGRRMVGGADPYGQPWRMGANEATALHVTVPVTVGDVSLRPGSYSLYSIPTETTWTVVVNREFQRWGIPISPDVRAQDVGQTVVTPEAVGEPVETLRYRFEPAGEGRLDLVMEWEGARLRIPIRPGVE